MGAGKTTELQRFAERATIAKRKCLMIKYSEDTRYTTDAVVQTHAKRRYDGETVACTKLAEISDRVAEYDLLAIDEGQFFGDLNSFCREQADGGMDIVVAALDGNFKREGFEQVNLLYAACESVEKLSAICVLCGDEASFTHRNISDQQEVLIGGMDLYQPVCRSCYCEKVTATNRARVDAILAKYDGTGRE